MTKDVHAVHLREWKTKREFRSTMAHHLVVEVHPMFRNGFANCIAEGGADLRMFRNVNRILHHHHGAEDELWFPKLRKNHPEVKSEIDILENDHKYFVSLEAKILEGSL